MTTPDPDAPLALADVDTHVVLPEPVAPTKEALTDLIASLLGDTYHCHRVWSAWGVGTMGEDDFSPVDESDTPAEIADEVLKLYAAPVAQPQEPNIGGDERRHMICVCPDCLRKPAPMTIEWVSAYPKSAAHMINRLAQRVDELEVSQPSPMALTGAAKVEPSFRWDDKALCHIPNLLIEFDPVPANSPNDAKGWADRDKLARAILAAAGAKQAVALSPMTDEQVAALILQTVYDGDASTPYRDAWAAEIGIPFARAIERAHGITSKPAEPTP